MDQGYAPPDTPLSILHADEDLVVLDKPAGLLSVPGKGPELADCLIARLRVTFPGALLVHRLDRDTSGVIVFALTPLAQRHLGLQFERRHTRKVYVARVAGHVAPARGRVDLPVALDWPRRPRHRVCHQTGRAAVTDWRVLRHEPDGSTRIRLMPITGRSHQLRVHMLALGHPILGDSLYAEGADRAHPRLMLHAERLQLRHPDGGREMTFRAPVPF